MNPEKDELKDFTPAEIAQFADDLIQDGAEDNPASEYEYGDFVSEKMPANVTKDWVRSELYFIASVRGPSGKIPKGRLLTAKVAALKLIGQEMSMFIEKHQVEDPNNPGTWKLDFSKLTEEEQEKAMEFMKIIEKAGWSGEEQGEEE